MRVSSEHDAVLISGSLLSVLSGNSVNLESGYYASNDIWVKR